MPARPLPCAAALGQRAWVPRAPAARAPGAAAPAAGPGRGSSRAAPAAAGPPRPRRGRPWCWPPRAAPARRRGGRAARAAGRARGGERRALPGLSSVGRLWSRGLYVTAALLVVLAALWCLQGLQGWAKLRKVNMQLPDWQKFPSSVAFESWFFGAHKRVAIRGRRIAVTLSSLEQDFAMDTFLVNHCGQTHRLLTACFLHNGVFHVLFNLGTLHSMAFLESGAHGAYLTTFLLAGIGGNAAFLLFGGGGRALGASGAVCGLIGFELVSRLRMRQARQLRAVAQQAFGVIVLGALLPGVCNWAHAGGLAVGAAVALAASRRSGHRRPLLPWPLLLAGLAAWPTARHFARALARALALGVAQPGALGAGLRLA